MNKAQLVEYVQKKLGDRIARTAAENSVDAVLAAIKQGLRVDKEVQLVGFGSFSISHRAARGGYNPYTKKPMKIKAMKTVRFKAGLDLREVI